MTAPWEVLVASSNVERRRELAAILLSIGIDPIRAATIGQSQEALAKYSVGLVFCDTHLSDGDYRDLLIACRVITMRPRVVVTSPEASWDEYLEAMHLGAFDVIASPCRPTDVEWMIIQARRDERMLVMGGRASRQSRPNPDFQHSASAKGAQF